MEYNHIPVLFNDVIEGLKINPDGIYFDGTLGGSGHSLGILKRLTGGKLIAFDKDETAIKNAKIVLTEYLDKITFIHDDYKNALAHFDEMGIGEIDGALLDMGVSSYQIDTADRGFSYINDAPLDMRMDESQKISAFDIVNGYSESELTGILFEYGEEPNAKRIARKIVERRREKPITSTLELSELVASCYPERERYKHGNPAKRTFQAIRIEVNDELEGLYDFIYALALRLKKGGRMCVITFHSLEDRIVKRAFVELEKDCVCDKHLPVCVCNKRKEAIIITKKPISGEKESEFNKRAGSAKLRIIERV